MRAQDPLFAQIPTRTVENALPTEVALDDIGSDGVGDVLRSEPVRQLMQGSFDVSGMISGDSSTLYEAAHDSAQQALEQLMPALFDLAGRASDAVGNTVDATGRDLNDVVLDAIERAEWAFDGDGKPTLQIAAHPDTLRKLQKAEAQATPEQRARYERIMQRKREEQDAARRTRRLRQDGD
jgi:hypothetical protein